MTARAEAKSDEKFALGLLTDHLTMSGVSEVRCAEIDPPDLVVTWENSAQWGVEVTRTYHQVASFDGRKPVSSEQIGASLGNFAKQLGDKTKAIRKCGYTLSLEGPGPFSSWKILASMKRWKKWKEETEEAIWKHIVSEESNILRIPGVWLKPGEPGKRWTITVSGGVAETGSATATMLWRALEDKTKDLPKWNGSFAERWLLLLNCYPLAEDLFQVEDTLNQLVLEHPELVGFNGVFWSGYPDRMLTPISLSSSL